MQCQTVGCPYLAAPDDTLCPDHRERADALRADEERRTKSAAAWEHQRLAERGVVTPTPPEPPYPIELDKRRR